MVRTWREPGVWQRAHEFVMQVYELAEAFPSTEKYRLVDQLCRSAISIPANIAEGHARHTTKEYIQLLYTARGSLEEARYHLLLARDLGYLTLEAYQQAEGPRRRSG